MRLQLLLLAVIGLSCSAPVPVDHELAAKQFFSSIAKASLADKHEEVIEIIFAKVDSFLPGFLTDEHMKKMRHIVIKAAKDGKEVNEIESPAEITQHLKDTLLRKVALLDDESRLFLGQLAQHFPREPPTEFKFRAFSGNIAVFRAEFDKLSDAAKASLAKQFAFFGRMDELQALVAVFDKFIYHIKGLCEQLPGVDSCDEIMKFF